MKRIYSSPVFPRLITFCVTYQCNCKCVICEIYKKEKERKKELQKEEIDLFFKNRAFRNLEVVRITGGEPFLRKDLTEIVLSLKKNTPARVFYITTNGTLPERIKPFTEYILSQGIKLHLQLSLDAASEKHDNIRGVPGLFNKIISTMEILKKIKEKNSRFEFGVNQTISKSNQGEMEKVNLLTKKYNCSHNITLAVKYHEGRKNEIKTFKKSLPFETIEKMSEKEIREIYGRIKNLKEEEYRIKKGGGSAYLRNLLEGYLNEGGEKRLLLNREEPKPPCMAFFTHLRILPDGGLVSCSLRSDFIVGNLRSQDFSKTWFSKEARRERKQVKACAGCWSECDIAPSIFYSGDVIRWAIKRFFS
jgi:MoaA/NifB/PqqE/SkfB family radical SAM enzyme